MKKQAGFALFLVITGMTTLTLFAWYLYSVQQAMTRLTLYRAQKQQIDALLYDLLSSEAECLMMGIRLGKKIETGRAFSVKKIINGILSFFFSTVYIRKETDTIYYLMILLRSQAGEESRITALLEIRDGYGMLSHVSFGTVVRPCLYPPD